MTSALKRLVDRLEIAATDRGVSRIARGRGGDMATGRGRRHARQARRELREYLAGRRTRFTVPVDLSALRGLRARVLAAARRVPFGRVVSYTVLAARVGKPRAARAVGNALAVNPVPLLVPCHRIIRADGTWAAYGLGARLKTRLLALERGHRRTSPAGNGVR